MEVSSLEVQHSPLLPIEYLPQPGTGEKGIAEEQMGAILNKAGPKISISVNIKVVP